MLKWLAKDRCLVTLGDETMSDGGKAAGDYSSVIASL
jgi:hypothetical protein